MGRARGQRRRWTRWVPLSALVVAAAGAWYAAGAARPPQAAIPGPIGGPEIAVDVNTLLGKKGPAFALRDGDGRIYQVTPGGTGRPLVLISHMGYY
ncbi:MAG: hypothetical protein QN120_04265 [Armatimonadota bacterium]|nr:hypothetical protein [Armatimonadota bacterium]